MKSKFIQTVLPICVLLMLVGISLFSPSETGGTGWMPLVGGFADTEILESPFISIPLAVLNIVAVVLGLYAVSLKTNALSFGRSALFFMLLVAANGNFLHFNQVYPVLACIVWMQYCLLNWQIFGAYMLLSAASLFYAPAIWIVPAMMLFLLFSGIPDGLRNFVKSFSGALLPHLYLIIFRWIKFGDSTLYLSHFYDKATDINPPFHHLEIPHYFMLLLLGYVLFRAISFIMQKNPMGTLAYLLKMEIVMLVLLFGMTILFGGNSNLITLPYIPTAIILSYYFKNCEKVSRTEVEYLLLICSFLICSISYMVN